MLSDAAAAAGPGENMWPENMWLTAKLQLYYNYLQQGRPAAQVDLVDFLAGCGWLQESTRSEALGEEAPGGETWEMVPVVRRGSSSGSSWLEVEHEQQQGGVQRPAFDSERTSV